MLAKVWSASLVGIDAVKVGVEVDIAGGLPGIVVVGLPSQEVQESRERVKAALKNAGYAVPMRKVVINLTPADLLALNTIACLLVHLHYTDPLFSQSTTYSIALSMPVFSIFLSPLISKIRSQNSKHPLKLIAQ